MDIKLPWQDWSVVRKIGSGSFGNVYEIERDMFGNIEKAAMKVITIPHNSDEVDDYRSQGYSNADITQHYHQCLQEIVREYSLMTRIKGHSNVVSCEDVQYVSQEDGIGWDIYIKMELLHPLMKSLDQVTSEAQIVKLGMDISNALVLCKDHNIIHRDIKPQNIFVSDNGDFKLGDFGIAKTVERTTGGTRIGTYKYMAPEVYNNHPYGAGADIYSLGLVLYWLLNEKRTPFLPMPPQMPTSAMEEQAGLRRFKGEVIPAPKYGSDELKRIVLKACAYASVDRYTSATELLADLKALENVSTVPFAHIPMPDPMEKVDTGTDVLNYGDARETVLLENEQDTVLLNEQETMLLNQQETALLEESAPEKKPQKKKKTALWVILGAAVIGIIILLLMLKSCDGSTGKLDDDGSTTKPTTGTTTTAPTTNSTTTASTTGNTTAAGTTGTTVATQRVVVVWDYGFNNKEETIYNIYLESREVLVGSKYSPPYEAQRDNFDFYGWYTEPDGKGQKIDTNTVITQTTEHTLYAYWGVHNHTLNFDLNGGSGSYPSRKINYNCTYGTVGGDLPQPTRGGYVFVGWFTKPVGGTQVTQMTKMGDKDVTIYAQWEKVNDNPLGLQYAVNKDKSTCTVTGIGSFVGTGLNIPNSIDGYKVTTVGEEAFSYCDELTSIVIPDGVTTIENEAFYSCNLTSITIPNSVTGIGEGAFSSNKEMTAIHVSSGNRSFVSHNNVLYSKDMTRLLCCLTTKTGEFTIPSSIRIIDSLAFAGCKTSSITIPNSITTIGDYAFAYCEMSSITIPNSVTTIGERAFSNCDELTSITIPNSVTGIGEGAFSRNKKLTVINVASENRYFAVHNDVLYSKDMTRLLCCLTKKSGAFTIPSGVRTIDDEAFTDCQITSIKIPNGMTCIGEYAFAGCWELTDISIPDSVTMIDLGAFSSCTSLTSFTIPNSVTIIGEAAFGMDFNLTTVTIPNSVTSVADNAFMACFLLRDVYYNGSKSQWNAINCDLFGLSDFITIHCTDGDITKQA